MESQPTPYLRLPRPLWAKLRDDAPMPLSGPEIARLRGQNEPVEPSEVEEIYLPLSRLLNLYIGASQDLYKVTTRFLGHPEPRVPYIIGVAGSVAVGKSTTSRVLKALLSRWESHPRVELVTTDGYLYPNAHLEQKGLMTRKGFPESYNQRALLQLLSDLKAGRDNLQVPQYSHRVYDIVPGEYQLVSRPDIVIVEGLNVLQVGPSRGRKTPRLFVSDFFDFTIYVDAPAETIRSWYLERFNLFRERARQDPGAYFHRFSTWSDARASRFAAKVWAETNEQNLLKNILPYRERARLILCKGARHAVEEVLLRRI